MVFTSTINPTVPITGRPVASGPVRNNFLAAYNDINNIYSIIGTGFGTVTLVSVVDANGVSGTVNTPTTTPEITLALGDITPISIIASGTILGSNLSGTNTGDQTITLTGDVTGSGTGSFAATIGNNKVTDAKMAASTANSLSGYDGSGNFGTVTVGSGLSLSSGTITATNAGAVTSVSGTANRITSTGGTTPVIDISAAYVGQSSITTLGTIGTGIWQGTKIGLVYGGTNADLSGTGGTSQVLRQSTLGANITVSQLAASDMSNGTTGSGAVVLASAISGFLSSSLTSAHIFVGNVSNVATDVAMSGDASITNAGALTVSKVNGVSYGTSPGTNTVPVVTGTNTVTYEAVPNAALANSSVTVTAGTGMSGGGAVSLGSSVTLNNAGVLSLTGDSVVYNNSASTGAVTLTLATQTANKIFAGPTTGAAAAPTFRSSVKADLPTPYSSAATNGQTFIGSTASGNMALANITGGSYVTVTNGANTIALEGFSPLGINYGSGADGAVTISGNTTLARTMYYSTLTINTGITLTTASYAIYCSGTLTTTGTGAISNNGNAGTSSVAASGTGGAAGGAGTAQECGTGQAGTAGADGGSGNGVNSTQPATFAATGAVGGGGGASGNGSAGTGAGSQAAGTFTLTPRQHLAPIFTFTSGGAVQIIGGGAGGRGGAGGAGSST